MKICKKLSFTLLELMLVLLLLGFGLSLTSIQIKKAYDEQQFLNEVEQVRSHLQMAQDLMLIMGAHVEVKFGEDAEKKALYYQLKVPNKVFPKMFAETIEERHFLKAIREIEFDGLTVKGYEEKVLKFYSKGLDMTPGKLVFSPEAHNNHEKSYQIVLVGYPQYIESRKYEPTPRASYSRVSPLELYPKELIEEAPHAKS